MSHYLYAACTRHMQGTCVCYEAHVSAVENNSLAVKRLVRGSENMSYPSKLYSELAMCVKLSVRIMIMVRAASSAVHITLASQLNDWHKML